jgi:hypothetical protein
MYILLSHMGCVGSGPECCYTSGSRRLMFWFRWILAIPSVIILI